MTTIKLNGLNLAAQVAAAKQAVLDATAAAGTAASAVASQLATYVADVDADRIAATAARAGSEAARDAAVDISRISTSDDVVEALVKNTGGVGPKTTAALFATYVGKNAPSLRRINQRLGLASAGTAGLARILMVGNSITAGTGSDVGGIDTGSAPALLQQALVRAGCLDGGSGRVWPNHTVSPAPSPADPRWAFSGFTVAAGGSALYVHASANGSTATFTDTRAGTACDLYWSNDSGSFTYSIDGGTPVAVAAGSGAHTWTGTSITGLDDTTHTITITTTSNAEVKLGAVVFRRDAGVIVENAGNGGALSSHWTPSAAWDQNGPTVKACSTDADLVIIESMLVNDGQNGVSPATHQANLEAVITDWNATTNVLLWIPPTPDPTLVPTLTFNALRDAALAAAAAHDVPVLDVSARWGSFATANANGYMSDAAHPVSAGYADIAQAFMEVLGFRVGAQQPRPTRTRVTLSNGWLNFGSGFQAADAYRDSAGQVRLRGLVKGGTATPGTTILTLPVEYRPAASEVFAVATSGGGNNLHGEVWVTAAGLVQIWAGGSDYLSLSGISFPTV